MKKYQDSLLRVIEKGKSPSEETLKMAFAIMPKQGDVENQEDTAFLSYWRLFEEIQCGNFDLDYIGRCTMKRDLHVPKIILTQESMSRTFNVQIIRDSTGFFAKCLDLPGCFSDGDTEEETLNNIKEAIKAHLGGMEKYKIESKENKGVYQVYV